MLNNILNNLITFFNIDNYEIIFVKLNLNFLVVLNKDVNSIDNNINKITSYAAENYSTFQFNYFLLFLFFCCAVFFSSLLFFVNYIFVKKNKYYDKSLPYECGFDVTGSPRASFNVQFYIVAILFLIFDVELVITYPWLVSLKYINFNGILVMCFFFLILLLSYFYESFNNCFNFKNFLIYIKK